jgi:hypothetical protein
MRPTSAQSAGPQYLLVGTRRLGEEVHIEAAAGTTCRVSFPAPPPPTSGDRLLASGRDVLPGHFSGNISVVRALKILGERRDDVF